MVIFGLGRLDYQTNHWGSEGVKTNLEYTVRPTFHYVVEYSFIRCVYLRNSEI
jgi:hypothetical protein